jgi:hypothetical protein
MMYVKVGTRPTTAATAGTAGEGKEQRTMSRNTKTDPQNLTNVEVSVLADISESYVSDLVRTGKLTRPISVEQVSAWVLDRGRKAGTSKSKWYHVKMSPAQFEEFVEAGDYDEYRDPAATEREAREKAAADARERLVALDINLG